jgi:hypothetical protein
MRGERSAHTKTPSPDGPQGHVCLIYKDEHERREVVTEFIRDGLAKGERVAYFADDAPDVVVGWLADHGIDVAELSEVSVAPAREVYCPDGEFKLERMFDYWRSFSHECTEAGLPGARATGETTWSREMPGGADIIEYEARLNDVLSEIPVVALCQYDVRRFDGATILDVLRVHPVMLVGGQLVHNPYYMRPEQFLAQRR